MPDALLKIISEWGSPGVLVVGDVMLDRYVRGEVSRISPEAPIPVMRHAHEESKLGGAGAVVLDMVEFGAKVRFVSIVGDDEVGGEVEKLVEKAAPGSVLRREPGRPTTVKTRFLGNVWSAERGLQHMLRLDRETTDPPSAEAEKALIKNIEKQAGSAKIVLVSDYFKGMLTPGLLSACMKAAAKSGVPVIVDPRRDKDYSIYRGATGMTPNRYEAHLATGVDTSTVEGCAEAGKRLVKDLGLEWCAVSMDKDGQYLATAGRGVHFPTRPRSVYDVTGAGDMVLSAIGMSIASGGNIKDAVRIANVAAGVEVGKVGVATVSLDEMRSAVNSEHPLSSDKIKEAGEISVVLDEHRRRGETVVFTNGCYDIIHAGHVNILSAARALGDVLVVGLNTDRSVRENKGKKRPVVGEKERARVLAALSDVDYVVLFDEKTPENIIETVRPDKLVKGEDWKDKGVVGREFVESCGGEVVLLPLLKELSTTNIIDRIKEL